MQQPIPQTSSADTTRACVEFCASDRQIDTCTFPSHPSRRLVRAVKEHSPLQNVVVCRNVLYILFAVYQTTHSTHSCKIAFYMHLIIRELQASIEGLCCIYMSTRKHSTTEKYVGERE